MTVCDRGGGSKIIENSVTYFMDGPLGSAHTTFEISANVGFF